MSDNDDTDTEIDELYGRLGFCGCGQPENALRYVLAGLKVVGMRGPTDMTAHSNWFQEVKYPTQKAQFVSAGAEYFFYYWASSKGLTEHGGSVPGWLTPDGEQLIKDIEQALAGD